MSIPQKEQAIFFTLLYEQYRKPITAYLFTHVHNYNVAEELMQETFLKAWLHLDTFDPISVKSWLFTIAKHTAMDYGQSLRARNDTMPCYDDSIDIPVTGMEDQALDRIAIEATMQAIQTADREYITRYYVEGYNQAEDAQAQGIERKILNMHVYRSRLAFKHAYKAAG